ncbi:unnamed protein product [Absidia cylindrospora]
MQQKPNSPHQTVRMTRTPGITLIRTTTTATTTAILSLLTTIILSATKTILQVLQPYLYTQVIVALQ